MNTLKTSTRIILTNQENLHVVGIDCSQITVAIVNLTPVCKLYTMLNIQWGYFILFTLKVSQ